MLVHAHPSFLVLSKQNYGHLGLKLHISQLERGRCVKNGGYFYNLHNTQMFLIIEDGVL